MPRPFRRVFFYLYILLFVVVAPLVVLYTAGYRFDLVTRRFGLTGAVNVVSTPRGAEVFLNGSDSGHRTPVFIDRLLPGTYHLTLKRDGSQPWERDIDIVSRQTTTINNAVLFDTSTPTSIAALQAIVTAASPDGDHFAYGVKTTPWFELWLYTISSGSYTLLDRETQSGTPTLAWSTSGDQLIMNGKERFTTSGPLSGNVTPNVVNVNGTTYEETTTTTGSVIQRIDSNGQGSTVAILPSGTFTLTDSTEQNLLLLQDTERHRLLLIDPNTSGPPILLNASATVFHWHDGWLYYTDSLEAHRFRPSDSQDDLLTRSSTPLTDVIPFPQSDTVLFVTATGVSASDLADPSRPVNNAILSADTITQFWIDSKGQSGYFYGTLNGETGLFTLPLTK